MLLLWTITSLCLVLWSQQEQQVLLLLVQQGTEEVGLLLNTKKLMMIDSIQSIASTTIEIFESFDG
jgi:hypothetical protein